MLSRYHPDLPPASQSAVSIGTDEVRYGSLYGNEYKPALLNPPTAISSCGNSGTQLQGESAPGLRRRFQLARRSLDIRARLACSSSLLLTVSILTNIHLKTPLIPHAKRRAIGTKGVIFRGTTQVHRVISMPRPHCQTDLIRLTRTLTGAKSVALIPDFRNRDNGSKASRHSGLRRRFQLVRRSLDIRARYGLLLFTACVIEENLVLLYADI
ncbi:hypothetical protein DFP94_1011197 [Fontibacillus phaseoli]|uniref:Uncharacterized protein n=1 Tax=Fontibacillus phaseoli TaxID=1416533 RepID=A0A369BSE3_9BACL|nr:hypothetical protein DFP94_1011197 [Fontibacillus phaseoli]